MLKEHKHDAVQVDTHPHNPHKAVRTGCKPPGQLPKWRMAQEYPSRPPPAPTYYVPSPLQTQFCPLCSLSGHSLLAPLYFSLHNFSGLKRLIFHPSWTMHAHVLHARDRTDSDIVKEQKKEKERGNDFCYWVSSWGCIESKQQALASQNPGQREWS